MQDLTDSRDKGRLKSGNKGSSSDPSSDEVIVPEWKQPTRMLHEFAKLGKVHLSLVRCSPGDWLRWPFETSLAILEIKSDASSKLKSA